jgi:tetratricopeptide (TPR) repeat protein
LKRSFKKQKRAENISLEAISPRRLWLFRLTLILLPIVFLLLLEGALRLFGFGYSTNFFKEEQRNGKTVVVNNDTFTLQFFPPELARWTDTILFDKEKPADTIRVFILGESAAMGDPQPAFAASRYMEVLLRKRFPGKKIEVINLGITAINSHVILPIARACAKQHGDFWIVYMGNNEMVGPFGAATIFGSRAPSLAAVRLNLALQRTRIGQLISTALRHLGKHRNSSWGGMKMFLQNQIAPEDSRKETVYKNFQGNVRDIVRIGTESGAQVLLNTVSVNLPDSPPFASTNSAALSSGLKSQFEKFFAEGIAKQNQSDFASAADAFAQAAKIDPHFAEAQFRWAECLERETNSAAREHFQLACDNDALPFRADSRVNRIIRETAGAFGEKVVLCDAEKILESGSHERIAGDEIFFEHVHFNPKGNYRLGLFWAEQVEKSLAKESHSTNVWMTQSSCDEQLGLSVWNRVFLLDAVAGRMQQPPLSNQFNNAARLAEIRRELASLQEKQREPGAVEKVRGEFDRALRNAPNDTFLLESEANFLESVGDAKGAAGAYHKITELLPHDFYSALQLGRLLGENGNVTDAEKFLRRAIEIRPNLPDGWYELGHVLADQQKFSEALESYDRALKFRPNDANYLAYKAKVLMKLHRRDEAVALFQRAVQLRPNFWEAHFELAGQFAVENRIADALKEYDEVLRINPQQRVARLNHGVLLVRLNRIEEGAADFKAVLKQDPQNRIAREYLEQVEARQKK